MEKQQNHRLGRGRGPIGKLIHRMANISIWLVVWNMAFIFLYLGNFIIPADFHIFFRGVETTNQLWLEGVLGIFLMVWRGSFPENARFSYSTWNVWKYHWEYSNISRVNYLP